MITESSSSVVPPEVSQNIEMLSQQMESLQKELSQGFSVWQSTLADEKA